MAKKSYRLQITQLVAGARAWEKGDIITPEDQDLIHDPVMQRLLKSDPPGLVEVTEDAPAAAPGG